jgi:hypothetical protein
MISFTELTIICRCEPRFHFLFFIFLFNHNTNWFSVLIFLHQTLSAPRTGYPTPGRTSRSRPQQGFASTTNSSGFGMTQYGNPSFSQQLPIPPPVTNVGGGARAQFNDIIEMFRQEMRNEMDSRVAPIERENRNLKTEVESLHETLKSTQAELSSTKRALNTLTETCEDQSRDLAARRRSIAELQARVADDDMWRAEMNQKYHNTDRALKEVFVCLFFTMCIFFLFFFLFFLFFLITTE